MSEQTTCCPTCGAECRVVGETTLHYEPIARAERARLAIAQADCDHWRERAERLEKAFRQHCRVCCDAALAASGEAKEAQP